eukprot:6463155-Prymnesium_polylepis.1
MRQQPPEQVALAFRVFRGDKLAKVQEHFPDETLSAPLLGVVQLQVSDDEFKDKAHSTLVRVRFASALSCRPQSPPSLQQPSPPSHSYCLRPCPRPRLRSCARMPAFLSSGTSTQSSRAT